MPKAPRFFQRNKKKGHMENFRAEDPFFLDNLESGSLTQVPREERDR